jgi:hypothetical protein
MSIFEGYVTKDDLVAQLPKPKSKRTLDRWERQGIGPPRIKVGRLVLYNVQSVRDWLASQEQRPRRTRGAW